MLTVLTNCGKETLREVTQRVRLCFGVCVGGVNICSGDVTSPGSAPRTATRAPSTAAEERIRTRVLARFPPPLLLLLLVILRITSAGVVGIKMMSSLAVLSLPVTPGQLENDDVEVKPIICTST